MAATRQAIMMTLITSFHVALSYNVILNVIVPLQLNVVEMIEEIKLLPPSVGLYSVMCGSLDSLGGLGEPE